MHSKSSDPVDIALGRGVAAIRERVQAIAAANPVVLIDGRSGAGKTSLAQRLHDHWPMRGGVQLIAMDSFYPGWDGLDAGITIAIERILRPHARGLISTWARWDWEKHEEAEHFGVNPARGIILEGCGAVTSTSAALADVTVWVQSPDASRQRRALDRDGDTYRPHWERWAKQEARHIARDMPHEQADIVVEVP
ncbi:sigma 54-interacting transcriptional regulator [Microbacterium sp. YY-01]|uniref:sigma 54-interacting transcriptional regulator n=1 Tax=Microbacterium sp. YY-01 TaxID=3421634 RepID=UPI003D183C01